MLAHCCSYEYGGDLRNVVNVRADIGRRSDKLYIEDRRVIAKCEPMLY